MARERDEHDEQIEVAAPLVAVMRALGWLPPTRACDVGDAMAQAYAVEPLPAALADPQRVLDQRRTPGMHMERSLIDPADAGDVDAGLRRAAREGGELPAAVIEAMRRDREAAQRPNEPDPSGQAGR